MDPDRRAALLVAGLGLDGRNQSGVQAVKRTIHWQALVLSSGVGRWRSASGLDLSELGDMAMPQSKRPLRRVVQVLDLGGRPCGIRTCDQRIKSPLLYQLS
jgi:hypothetical protein